MSAPGVAIATAIVYAVSSGSGAIDAALIAGAFSTLNVFLMFGLPWLVRRRARRELELARDLERDRASPDPPQPDASA